MFFQQGRVYMGGVNVPFFVSDSKLRDGLVEKGFSNIQIVARDDFPIVNLPPRPPGTSDDWDTVVVGTRTGPDASIDVPIEARWVFDVSPLPAAATAAAAAPTLPLQPAPGAPQAWPPLSDLVTTQTPLSIPQVPKLPLLVGLGVVGGTMIGWWAVQHLFVEGITGEERKNFLVFSGAMLAIWGASELVGLDKAWWLTVEGIAGHATSALEK